MDWGSLSSVVVNLVVAAIVLAAVAVVAMNTVYVLREYERLVVFRLGRSIGSRGPGLVLLIPVVDRAVRVDLREQFLQIPHQTCITKDNAPISIDFLIYWKVIDPALSVIQVANFAGASQGIATTTLRAVIGDIPLDDVLAKREQINQLLRQRLDEVTERWGVKVTSVEIREIVPPSTVQEAMNRQMSAERSRRAMVLESDGKREAAILVAQGEKQSAVLRAEGARQAAILEAEGARQAQALRAEGYALALKTISDVARGLDSQTMGLQYLDALKMLGSSPATKLLLPLEFASLLRPVMDLAQQASRTDGISGKGA
ncbi:MAG TPA: SPFH domain-containing protein [Chloroflexota bacterium]|jgi:regulator of protease activity HflC (stomatin/prohibitin superfamily)|nr:SPFH domain-containing protein [Chloroflexota bacterium]